MLFKWKDDFSVNVKEIDNQHKELFRIGSEAYDIMSLKDGIDRYDEIVEIMIELKDYAAYHLKFEEELLKKHNYDEYKDHKMQHDKFIKKVNSFDLEKADEEQRKAGMDLVMFIANWIEGHILGTDKKYTKFLNEKGIY